MAGAVPVRETQETDVVGSREWTVDFCQVNEFWAERRSVKSLATPVITPCPDPGYEHLEASLLATRLLSMSGYWRC
jgi:hypothetical protein